MQTLTPEKVVQKIIKTNGSIEKFWSNSHGWSPSEAAILLSNSMLHWQTELSETLKYWISKSQLSEGELILAWTNLGALVEGSLKLFLCVYLKDYNDDPNKLIKYGKATLPDEATLGLLKNYFLKKSLFSKFMPFVEKIQRNRNVIHSFKANSIDNQEEFIIAISEYLELLEEIQFSLPYPDDIFRY